MTIAPTPAPSARAPRRAHIAWAILLTAVMTAIAVVVLYDLLDDDAASSRMAGSGISATETRSVPPFESVELSGGSELTIRVGERQSVVVHADHNLLRRITTDVRGDSLVIGNAPGSFRAVSPMRIEVSVPILQGLTLSGSGIVVVSGVDASRLTLKLPGSGLIRTSGTADVLDVELSGSGDAQLAGLVARDVDAVVSGSGRILVTATQRLDATVTGSGVIVYGGSPTHVTQSVTGSGAVLRS